MSRVVTLKNVTAGTFTVDAAFGDLCGGSEVGLSDWWTVKSSKNRVISKPMSGLIAKCKGRPTSIDAFTKIATFGDYIMHVTVSN